jgi:hypothetical protein
MTACRTLFVALAVAIAVASACLALARWAAVDLAAVLREGRREGVMYRRLAVSHRVIEDKTAVANDLIAGRVTLREAVARFRELNALVEGDGQDGVAPFRVARGEEAVWWNVLVWVRAELMHRPRRDAAVLDRLKAEYRERFGHDPDFGAVMPPTP